MYIKLQILLGTFLNTLALTSRVSISVKTDLSSHTTVDDPNNISTPFTLTANGGAVGYGTRTVIGNNFKALVIQPPGVPGSTFTLVDGELVTSDNMIICRYYAEDLSLRPKRMYAAPEGGFGQRPVNWQTSNSGGAQTLTLLAPGSPSPIIVEGDSPEGLDWLYFPLLSEPGTDLIIGDADDSSNSFLVDQESLVSQTGYGSKDGL